MARKIQVRVWALIFMTALVVVPMTGSFADDVEPTSPVTSTSVFDHQAHTKSIQEKKLTASLDMKKCGTCHVSTGADDPKPAPTTRAHAPCLNSGCHLKEFLGSGPTSKQNTPDLFRKSAQFCGTCHKSKSGAPPPRFSKAQANALYENKVQANFHVEMNHFAHSQQTSCSTCHVVDKTTFKLAPGRLSHKQCATCHADSEQPMTNCSSCHTSPGPTEYFVKTRKKSDVRVCPEDGSTSKRPCFKHERIEHRFIGKDDPKPLECSSCHFMFKKEEYRGSKYKTLADVKAAPMMDNARDLAHKNCGASGCHRSEVDGGGGRSQCSKCHSNKFVNSLFD